MAFTETTLSREDIFSGKIINVHRDKVRLQDGSTSYREVVEHPGGVAVLPVDSNNCATVVRQFRYPYGEEIIEIPAGKLESGEEPLTCAIRELGEETGCVSARLTSLGSIIPSPGYCRETIYIYLAEELSQGDAHTDEGEFLQTIKMSFDELFEMVQNGTITDAKTVTAVLKANLIFEDRRKADGKNSCC